MLKNFIKRTIGVVRELKCGENRVAMTPHGAKRLVELGHNVLIQSTAGERSGFHDQLYKNVGANIIKDVNKIWQHSDIICKVKEPIGFELASMRSNQVVFGYFHFASNDDLFENCKISNAITIPMENVRYSKRNNEYPLLSPMSEIAGKLAVHQAIKLLERDNSHIGLGTLLSGATGVLPSKVMILGGGTVGSSSAKLLSGLGADVYIFDTNLDKLQQLETYMPKNVKMIYSSKDQIISMMEHIDVAIGAIYINAKKAPFLVNKTHTSLMKKHSVIIDVCIDQGGCFESSKVTTHDNPTYIYNHVIHYCVPNMPALVPKTSTIALTNATIPYIIDLANKGWEKACEEDEGLFNAINC